jgi:hypothetical protein
MTGYTYPLIKSIINGLDTHQENFNFIDTWTPYVAMLEEMKCSDIYLFSQLIKTEKISLAHKIFKTGNLKAIQILETISQKFPFAEQSETCIGRDSRPFPFPSQDWSNSERAEAFQIWKNILGEAWKKTQFESLKNAVSYDNLDIITSLIKEDAFWEYIKDSDTIDIFIKVLQFETTSKTKMAIVALLSPAILHIETYEEDMRATYNVFTYLIGCSILGYQTPINLKNSLLSKTLPKSAHDVFVYQAKLGKWYDWVGLSPRARQQKINTILSVDA